jgi:hypothetical protein
MADQSQDMFQKCKSQFEAALLMFRLGCGELDSPQFGDERFEIETMNKILWIRERAANQELVQLYLLALNRKNNQEASDPKKSAHKVGDILFEYFQGEGQAILYLSNVYPRTLVRLTQTQRQEMLASKIPDDPFIRGPNFKWTDDMWWYIYEMCQSFDFYAPLGSACKTTKKRRRDLDDELSDPTCALRSAGKRVRSFSYHL